MERALIWILTPATSADKIASSSTCWHRNIMVRKCFCAMKQIGRSKYTAKNQTICFKRTQELVKTSWNIAGEKAAATPISEADRHCSCSSRVLSGPPALHCNDTFNEDKNFFSLTPKGLQNVPVLGVPLCMSGKRKIPNCLDLTSSSLRTGACLSSGHVNTGYLLHHDAKEKRNLKRLFYPLFFSITVAGLLQESLPIHHCSSLDVTLPARAWPLFPEHPRCYIAPSRCTTWTGAPAWLTDFHHSTEAASFHLSGFISPGEACVPLQPPLEGCPGKKGRP